MNNHPSKQTRCCAHCGQHFIVNPRVGRRHRYCPRPECVRKSQAASRRKWLKRNGGKKYFLESDGKDRVQRWRKKHPRYWKKDSFEQHARRPKYRLTKSLREMIGDVALQDSIDMNLPLKIGIISHLTGTALQDVIAKEIRRLMLRGHAILRGKIPKM